MNIFMALSHFVQNESFVLIGMFGTKVTLSHLVAIAGTIILVPCHVVKSLQLIWDRTPVDLIYGWVPDL